MVYVHVTKSTHRPFLHSYIYTQYHNVRLSPVNWAAVVDALPVLLVVIVVKSSIVAHTVSLLILHFATVPLAQMLQFLQSPRVLELLVENVLPWRIKKAAIMSVLYNCYWCACMLLAWQWWSVPTLFRVLPNFHKCFYITYGNTGKKVFYFFYKITRRKLKRGDSLLYQSVNSPYRSR